METVPVSAVAVAGDLRFLTARLRSHGPFQSVIGLIRAGHGVMVDGAAGSGSALFSAALGESATGPLVAILPTAAQAQRFAEATKLFTLQRAVVFPPATTLEGGGRPDDQLLGDRLRVLKGLLDDPGPMLCATSVDALLQAVPAREVLRASSIRIKRGQTLAVQDLLGALTAWGFRKASMVALPGEFSIRGGLLDVFPADRPDPIRIELFGDQVESIRCFNVETQRSVEQLAEIELTVLSQDAGKYVSFFDYLPQSSWVVLIDPPAAQEQGQSYLEKVGPSPWVLDAGQVWRASARFPTIEVWDIVPDSGETRVHLGMISVEGFSGAIDRIQGQLDALVGGQEVHLVCATEAEVTRLSELFGNTTAAREERLRFTVGRLEVGFQIPALGVVVLSTHQLFQRTIRDVPQRRLVGRPIEDFLDLREGDLVVHVAHGIARYRGLKLLKKDEQVEEHLVLEFAEGTRLYVPVSKIGLVQKYVGGSRAHPKLSRLGGRTWQKQKEAVARAVFDLAAEMLELQAVRQTRPGIAFPPDSLWQQEFDASFPFEETPDQLAAMAAIKADMIRPRPMDRLLCGDVGFGKTELAMRAAFKAVDAGYQVAVLVPTTVLAEQHARTFHERMAEFPFNIAVLSRFCTAKEEAAVLEGLADGSIDIVIGTHRLGQADVRFHNLGLVIIDEEQRFGVEVKERLKTLRQTVDVLTMTATPIPRTLHMALVGLRDVSNLATPPQERLAVETHVCRFEPDLIRQAVLRELSRNGQIYFVHNRVKDIEVVERRLRAVVPEARIRVAHAQMPDKDLEEIMLAFVRHEFDLLLTTTIIENGLDIPNVNTIFIDQADRFGLADLHQLRGRVGRYKHRAYCYLLIDPQRRLNPNAWRRLQAIEEFSHLGAGFALAMRDLEIRGAGNILGTEQSGHIAAVGYELYCQLLEYAVRRLQNQPLPTSVQVEVDLPCQAYLPDTYIPDIRAKIDVYRKISQLTDLSHIYEFAEELRDRFGTPPPPAARLLDMQELRIHAHWWRIRGIRQEPGFVVFQYSAPRKIQALRDLTGRRLRIVDEKSAYLPADGWSDDVTRLIAELKSLLRQRPASSYNSAPQKSV